MTEVHLLGKPGCHLCDDLRPELVAVLNEYGQSFVELDITTDDQLYARWWDQIPVVLVDGEVVATYRLDAGRLRAALEAGR